MTERQEMHNRLQSDFDEALAYAEDLRPASEKRTSTASVREIGELMREARRTWQAFYVYDYAEQTQFGLHLGERLKEFFSRDDADRFQIKLSAENPKARVVEITVYGVETIDGRPLDFDKQLT